MRNPLLNCLGRLLLPGRPSNGALRKEKTRQLTFLLAFALFPMISRAANITLGGTFTADDSVQLFSITLAAPAAVDFRSYGYAGGTTSTGTVAPRGGFDTILTLFSASGTFLAENDDGAGVATDPSTGLAGDARITTSLTPGSYLLALTQYDNFSRGNLADGFVEAGKPNFTADPNFATGGACPGNLFRDISGTDGRCRTGNWTVNFTNVASVTAVPEPSALLLASLGLALLLVGHRRHGKKATVLAGCVIASLATGLAHAQTGSSTNYANNLDYLNGQRLLLKVTDLQAVYSNSALTGTVSMNTANSQVTPVANSSLPSHDPNKSLQIFSARMFNQPAAISLTALYNVNNNGYFTLWLQGVNTPSTVAAVTPLPQGDEPALNCGTVADFTQDSYEDVALSFDGGRLVLISPNDVNDATKGFRQTVTQLDALKAMAAGDFNGDGNREIAGLNIQADGSLKLEILAIDSKTLTPSVVAQLPLTMPNGVNSSNPISVVSVARGRFNTANHDQLALTFSASSGPSIVEIIDFATNPMTPKEGPQFTASSVSIPYGYLQVQTGQFGLTGNPYDQIVWHESSPSDGGRFFEVISADPSTLQLKAHGPVTYNQFPCALGIQVGNFDHRQSDPSNPGQSQPNLNNEIALLYCNNQTLPTGNPYYSPDTLGMTLNIYSVDPTTLDINASSPESIYDLTEYTWINTDKPSSIAFVATDLQGRSVALGEPTVIDLSSTDQPSVVLGTPPMHVDFISPDGIAPPVLLNVSMVPDFTNTYENSTSEAHPHSETQKTSWSFGAKEQGTLGLEVGDVEEGNGLKVTDTITAAQKLKSSTDSVTNTFQGQQFALKTTSNGDDAVSHSDTNLRIWVYPVIGQTACPKGNPSCQPNERVPLTIQFSAPTTYSSPVVQDGGTLSWYQPPWEPGNILSYPASLDQLQSIYPGPGSCDGKTQQPGGLCVLGSGVAFFTDKSSGTETTQWNVTSETGTTTSFDQNYSFENDFSVTGAAGLTKVVDITAGFDIDLSGSYGLSHLTNDSTMLGTSTGLTVNKPGSFLQPEGNYQYLVTPYILGNVVTGGVVDNQQLSNTVNTFGMVRAVFTADPLATSAGHWWQSAYTQAPDVALNHPQRWTSSTNQLPAQGNPPSNCLAVSTNTMTCAELNPRSPDTPWTDNFHFMRGFFISSAGSPGQGPQLESAKAGDVLSLQARVYNYSLPSIPSSTTMPSDAEVHVRFYFTPWIGTAAAGPSVLINEVVTGPIPPFNDVPGAPPNWVLVPTTFDTSAFDETKNGNVNLVFWVIVWMQDKNTHQIIGEMPGHGLTDIPGTLTSFADAAKLEEKASDGNYYSNNVGFYPQIFYIAGKLLGSAPGPTNATVNIGKLDVSVKRVTPSDNVVLSATLSASGGAAQGVTVNFYDGDPQEGGQIFATQRIPRIGEDVHYQVATRFRSGTCGVHELFAVVNKGKPSEVVRRAPPVRVDCSPSMLNTSVGSASQKLNLQ
ncbi:MAG: DVUA0089 family protein [Acidobacteriaceae bacterium]|nr:DVUA0089 family protein [Acidobacteriaceae bacterium]